MTPPQSSSPFTTFSHSPFTTCSHSPITTYSHRCHNKALMIHLLSFKSFQQLFIGWFQILKISGRKKGLFLLKIVLYLLIETSIASFPTVSNFYPFNLNVFPRKRNSTLRWSNLIISTNAYAKRGSNTLKSREIKCTSFTMFQIAYQYLKYLITTVFK